MRILITGSEGVLGSVLKTELRRRGHQVFGCDLMHTADPSYVRADVAERRQIARAFEFAQPELVYHFAAEFGRKNGQEYYENLWRVNCIGTHNVIEECIASHAQLVFASSSEAYGLSEAYTKRKHHPLKEDLLEKFVPAFHNEYSLSKWTNERQIQTAARNHDLEAVILRFFNVYGPPERYSPYRSVVCQFAHKILNHLPIDVNLEGYRSHLWIGDWCQTVANIVGESNASRTFPLALGIDSDLNPAPVFNIGSNHYISIQQLYTTLCKIIEPDSVDVVFITSETANTATKRPNNTLAEKLLGHHETMPFEEGLRLTVEFLRNQNGR